MQGPTNCWDRTWFSFVTPLTAIGLKRQLTMDDCFQIPEEFSCERTTNALLNSWNTSEGSLLRIFLRHHSSKLVRLGLFSLLNAAGEISRPCLVYALLKVLEHDSVDNEDLWVGLGLCCGGFALNRSRPPKRCCPFLCRALALAPAQLQRSRLD